MFVEKHSYKLIIGHRFLLSVKRFNHKDLCCLWSSVYATLIDLKLVNVFYIACRKSSISSVNLEKKIHMRPKHEAYIFLMFQSV